MPKGMEEQDRVNPKPRVRGNRLKPLVTAQLGRRAQECTLSPTGARNKGCFAAGPEGLGEHTLCLTSREEAETRGESKELRDVTIGARARNSGTSRSGLAATKAART